MRKQVKVTQNGHEKRLFDWNAEKREMYISLNGEIITLWLDEDQHFKPKE